MSDVLLESRWDETKDALLEGLEGSRRSSMSVVLENTKKYLAEAASTGATASGNVATLNRVILPVIRRIVGHPHLMTTMPTATAIRLARTRGKLVKPNQSKWT